MCYGRARSVAWRATLDRLRTTLLDNAPAPDANAPVLEGSGTPDDPFAVTVLPFSDRRDTRTFGTRAIATYPRCSTADERGREVYYRVDVTARTRLRAFVFDRSADVDVHLLAGQPSAAGCVARSDLSIDRTVEPGTYYVVVDTFADRAGDYTVVISAE